MQPATPVSLNPDKDRREGLTVSEVVFFAKVQSGK
jgi:hypothetical protein